MLGVLDELRKHLADLPSASELYETLAKQTIDALDISKLCSMGAAERGSAHITQQSVPSADLPSLAKAQAIDPGVLAGLFDGLLLARANDNLMMQLAIKIALNAALINRQEIMALWLPFLNEAMDVDQKHANRRLTTRLRFIAEAILEVCFTNAVGKKPPSAWNPPQRHWICNCPSCAPFRAFLASHLEAAKMEANPTAQTHAAAVLDASSLHHPTSLYVFQYRDPKYIVVQKRSVPDAKAQKEWEDRSKSVMGELGRLDQERLGRLLGGHAALLKLKTPYLPENTASVDLHAVARDPPLFSSPSVQPLSVAPVQVPIQAQLQPQIHRQPSAPAQRIQPLLSVRPTYTSPAQRLDLPPITTPPPTHWINQAPTSYQPNTAPFGPKMSSELHRGVPRHCGLTAAATAGVPRPAGGCTAQNAPDIRPHNIPGVASMDPAGSGYTHVYRANPYSLSAMAVPRPVEPPVSLSAPRNSTVILGNLAAPAGAASGRQPVSRREQTAFGKAALQGETSRAREMYLGEQRRKYRTNDPVVIRAVDQTSTSRWESSALIQEEYRQKLKLSESLTRVDDADNDSAVAPKRLGVPRATTCATMSSQSRLPSLQVPVTGHNSVQGSRSTNAPKLPPPTLSPAWSSQRQASREGSGAISTPQPRAGRTVEYQSTLGGFAVAGASSPSTPSTPSSERGFKVFSDELEPRLRSRSVGSSGSSIRAVILKRWAAMSAKHRRVYADMEKEEAVAPSPSTRSTPRHHLHAGLGGTSTRTPIKREVSIKSEGARKPATPAKPLAPITSNAAPGRGTKRKAAEVIDLTLDD